MTPVSCQARSSNATVPFGQSSNVREAYQIHGFDSPSIIDAAMMLTDR